MATIEENQRRAGSENPMAAVAKYLQVAKRRRAVTNMA